jgi:hypothetical protein
MRTFCTSHRFLMLLQFTRDHTPSATIMADNSTQPSSRNLITMSAARAVRTPLSSDGQLLASHKAGCYGCFAQDASQWHPACIAALCVKACMGLTNANMHCCLGLMGCDSLAVMVQVALSPSVQLAAVVSSAFCKS